VCDFCGCPGIEPFATLTEDHGTLEALAELFLRNGAVAAARDAAGQRGS
jgi:hypothetical protein